jgi:hypothetical protein
MKNKISRLHSHTILELYEQEWARHIAGWLPPVLGPLADSIPLVMNSLFDQLEADHSEVFYPQRI